MNRHEMVAEQLRSMELTAEQRQQIMGLVKSSPSRQIKGGLNNVVVHFFSVKMNQHVVVESHTAELLYAIQLELDPDVIAYFPQVACKSIRFGKHVRSGSQDFLVVRRKSVDLVECKVRSDFDRLLKKPSGEWVGHDGVLTNLAYGPWAALHGMKHHVWMSPDPADTPLRNLEQMYNTFRQFSPDQVKNVSERMRRELADGPKSLDWLMHHCDGLTLDHAAAVLSRRELFGPIDQVPLTDTQNFFLCLTKQQADACASPFFENAVESRRQLESPLARASSVDVEHAQRRFDEICAAKEQGRKVPRHLSKIAQKVAEAEQAGLSGLEACLTDFASSGNRISRLSPVQEEATKVITERFANGEFQNRTDAYAQLLKLCRAKGDEPQSRQAFTRRLNSMTSAVKRALNTGGLRAYQKAKLRSDARFRSGKALAPHAVLHIDSTKIDNRVLGDSEDDQDCPLLYLGVDEHTESYMSHAFVFGPARRSGVAILIRNYVRRHGRIFECVHIDRGPENTSDYLTALARRYKFSIRISPTAASVYNSEVERAVKRVNSEVSHGLIGSTEPDKAGRAVDGKFKSYKTARHVFRTIGSEIEKAIYHHFPGTPTAGVGSRREQLEEGMRLFPSAGRRLEIDEEFLFLTSVPHTSNKYDRSRGFDVYGRYYNSSELQQQPAGLRVTEVRIDPEDPTFIWVQTNNGRFKAFCNLISMFAHKPLDQKQFHSMYLRATASSKRIARNQARLDQYIKTAEANRLADGCADGTKVPETTSKPHIDLLTDAHLKSLNSLSADDFDQIENI